MSGYSLPRPIAEDDTARAFYAHFDFEPSPTDPLHLLLLIRDARSVVGR